MARTRTWEISDEFWKLVEPLIPTSLRTADKTYKRRPGAGRKPKYSNRTYFAAIVYISPVKNALFLVEAFRTPGIFKESIRGERSAAGSPWG